MIQLDKDYDFIRFGHISGERVEKTTSPIAKRAGLCGLDAACFVLEND